MSLNDLLELKVVQDEFSLFVLHFLLWQPDGQPNNQTKDVWDTLGTNRHNITKDIIKYTIDNSGQARNFHGRNREEQALLHDHHELWKEGRRIAVVGDYDRPQYRYVAGKTIKLLQQEGEISSSSSSSSITSPPTTATDLTPDTIQEFFNAHSLLVIDYYAPWCLWCQRLSPTWDDFANEIQQYQQQQQRHHQQQQHSSLDDVGVGKVDCVEHAPLCKGERIMAFPTIRWYQTGGKAIVPDYIGDRTVEALMEYAIRQIGSKINGDGDGGKEEEDEEQHHPGCQLSGHLMVNRVPGTLIIEAKSINHDIHLAMMNLTHRVHHLSFGPAPWPDDDDDDTSRWRQHLFGFLPFFFGGRSSKRRRSSNIPDNYKRMTNPMKETFFPTYHPHEAYHHSLKVVNTEVDSNHHRMFSHRDDDIMIYQILEESQLILYNEQSTPEIKFVWDLSPMGVKVTRVGIPWYEYLTSLLAIIGGTYTTLGLINATLLRIFKPKRL